MEQLPDFLWTLPAPTIVFVLLMTGVLVTKREHSNMIKLMEFFQKQSTDKDAIIQTKDATITALTKAAEVTTTVVETVRSIAADKRENHEIS